MGKNKYTPYREYIVPQICPICGKSHPVGKLSGGKTPKYFCMSCLIEFDVKLMDDGKIVAELPTYTASGIKAGQTIYKYQPRNKRFIPI